MIRSLCIHCKNTSQLLLVFDIFPNSFLSNGFVALAGALAVFLLDLR